MNDEKPNKILFALIIIVTGFLSIYDISSLPYALIGYGIGYGIGRLIKTL